MEFINLYIYLLNIIVTFSTLIKDLENVIQGDKEFANIGERELHPDELKCLVFQKRYIVMSVNDCSIKTVFFDYLNIKYLKS
jgi:hypothetical protein